MDNIPNENTPVPTPAEIERKRLLTVIAVLSVLLVILLGVLIYVLCGNSNEELPTDPTDASTAAPTETTEPVEDTLQMLPEMAALYAENPDIAGYIRIEGTTVDYPVMYTPDNEEKYSRKDFYGKYSISGLPFINKDCSIDPESDNLIIYGHNMRNGKGFQPITGYAKKSFYEEHPTFTYSTLYEERTYEVVAAFYDRVYYKYEDVFKFYQFIDYENEEEFNEAVTAYAEKALYETGVELEYGDHLMTLITCSYHAEYGRFVVIARQVTE